MGKYKLLALDMDGTLLDDDQEISLETASWIHKAMQAGIHVCLSTGRVAASALPYGEELGLDAPMVTVNGSEVWKSPRELWRRYLLDQEQIRQVKAIADEAGCWFWAYTTDGLFNKKNWPDSLEPFEWLKFGYNTEDDQLRKEIRIKLQQLGMFEITNSSPVNLEINPRGISKKSGIQEICSLLDITMEEVIAVGDSLNDLAAIQAVGLGVAMGNAQQAVKEAADLVVASNNDDGIVEVIRDYIFA